MSGQTQARSQTRVVGVAEIDRGAVDPDPGCERRELRGDGWTAADDLAREADRGIDGPGGPVRPVVDAVAVAQQVQARARAHVDQCVGTVEVRRRPGEAGTDDGAPATFVGLYRPDGEEGQHLRLAGPEEIEEERAGIGVGTSGVDLCQRVVGPLEDQEVHGGEQRRRQMGRRRCRLHELEDLAISGYGRGDALVERGGRAAMGREPLPHERRSRRSGSPLPLEDVGSVQRPEAHVDLAHDR